MTSTPAICGQPALRPRPDAVNSLLREHETARVVPFARRRLTIRLRCASAWTTT
ncbi:hypothetical protein [Streptomyces sp. NPDC058335]|uniref:hypothetical protein n=1 Tax=Streptomyces sp. NPDC058335 TaxID=3346451 RepID=UPI0036493CF6